MQWHDFLPRLLAYAVEAGFLHGSEPTVMNRSSSVSEVEPVGNLA
jgi:hypothetical protein